jgi:sulfatase maturation enzyme AslB (radical SAM superfamily)
MNHDFTNLLKDRFCSKPFEFAALNPSNIGALQCCWLTKSMGVIDENVSIQDVWNSESAQDVRNSIHDGSFRYCMKELCPHIHNGELPFKNYVDDPKLKRIIEGKITKLDDGPQVFQFNQDRTCNLSCPSCRTELILETSGAQYESMLKTLNLSITDEALKNTREISLTGSGDPFASKIYRDFLISLDGARYPHLEINLYTNGVLFDQDMWAKMHKIQKNISHVRVSLDGISEDVYNNTRRGGNLARVKKNIAFLAELLSEGFFKDLILCFVVQKMNYLDMIAFVEFAKNFPGVKVHFQKIYNWGTYSPKKFILHDICDERNPDFDIFLSILKDPILSDPIVDLGNIIPFREKALNL